MSDQNTSHFIEALKHFGASDLNEQILKEVSLEQLLKWSKDDPDQRLCFRSSWALEHLLLKNNQLFNSTYNQLLENFKTLKNWSALRSYTKLIMWLLSKSNKTIKLSDDQREIILEKTFDILEDSDCPIAVKVNGFDILYRLIPYYDWLAKELGLLIELNLEKENTPALKSRGIYILKRLRN